MIHQRALYSFLYSYIYQYDQITVFFINAVNKTIKHEHKNLKEAIQAVSFLHMIHWEMTQQGQQLVAKLCQT